MDPNKQDHIFFAHTPKKQNKTQRHSVDKIKRTLSVWHVQIPIYNRNVKTKRKDGDLWSWMFENVFVTK